MAHRTGRAVAVTHAGHIVAHTAVSARMMSATVVTIPIIMVVMVVRVMPVVVMISPTVGPVRTIAPVRVRIPGISPVRIPAPIAVPIRTITPTDIEAWVIIPIEGVVAVHINVCFATASVIIVIIVNGRGGLRAKTLDARGKISIVISLCGCVHYAVRVSHRFRGLVNGFGIVGVVFTVGIIGLVVVFRVAADAGAHIGTVAGGHAIAVWRVIDIVLRHLTVRRAAGENHHGNDWDKS